MNFLDEDIKVALILLVFLSIGCYTCYCMGKWIERRELTKVFITSTEMTYTDGFSDGQLKGYHEGLLEGTEKGYKKCLNEDFKIRDAY